MERDKLRMGLLLALLVSGFLLRPDRVAIAEEGCVSDKCHAKILKGKTVHPIAESCDSCHQAEGPPHPQHGEKTFKLTAEPPDLCYTCHDRDTVAGKGRVHPPVEQGMCTTCHNPHSADEPKLLVQPMKDLCGVCHSDRVDFKVMHGPVSTGACTACHNPHGSPNPKLLVKEPPDLCFGCHLDMPEVLEKKNVHPALAGGCTSCHNPHGSDYPRMLAQEGQELCFMCHPQIAETVKNAPVPHPALMSEKGCVSCHSPHASDNEKMLLNPVKDICTTCHTDVIPQGATVLHGPNNDGKCTRCHEPHGSQNEKLLVAKFPTETYVPYTDNDYALCFTCHKRDLLEFPETSFATNFRDGERNLHYLHVHNKQKGRSCKLCHSWHGSKNPKLIADTVPFGKWSLPLRFVKTDTGGGCSPGCHKPQYYDRKTPGKRPDNAAR